MNRRRGSDDEPTQMMPNRPDGGDQDRTLLQNRQGGAGFSMPDRQAPLRGTVVGEERGGGQPPRGAPVAPPPAGQGETVFIPAQPDGAVGAKPFDPVVGWLAIVKGPGRGESRPVYYGQNSIGRDPKQRVSIDFGDQKISRETHAFIVYDEVQRKFFIRDNGKSNLVRHKGNLVMMPTEIADRDEISIGATTLMFIALCNTNFDWLAADEPTKA
jgi:FHA domain